MSEPVNSIDPAEARKILKFAVIGAFVAFGIVMLVSDGMPTGQRVTNGLMCAGAGFVTGALLAANFGKEDEEELPGHDSANH